MEIIVHTKTTCSWCDKSKRWLKDRGYSFKTVIHDDDDERSNFYQKCGDNVRTVPQIFVDGKRIGGYRELVGSKLNNFDVSFNEDF